MESKKVEVPIYGEKFEIILFDKSEEVEKHIEGLELNTSLDNYDGCVFQYKNQIYLALNTSKEGYPTPGIIAHEAKHLLNEIYLNIGAQLDLENDEPEAYLLGWIVNRIHEFIAETEKR
tara:strand:- start:13374 stop:13730 length:357 start_codon:yes stop_codon:yes gene_type:complete